MEQFFAETPLTVSSLVTQFRSAALQFTKIIISTFKTINVCTHRWGES